MASEFTHLHLHTDHSFQDGILRIPDAIRKAKETGMKACAITDHGNMTGAIRFYKAAKKAGIKPILGCEAYFTHDPAVKSWDTMFHLTLLAKNEDGYHNLCRMISAAHEPVSKTVGRFWHRPRVTPDLLERYSGGLIGMSACIGGEIPQLVRGVSMDDGSDGYRSALARARELSQIFDGDFYLEIMRNGYEELDFINPVLERISNDTGIRMVATNDVHYLDEKDWELRNLVSWNAASGNREGVDSSENAGNTHGDLWMRTPDEMAELFVDKPELLAETMRIADKCDVEIRLGHNIYPRYEVEGGDPHRAIAKLAREGLERRGLAKDPRYAERLEYEISQITANDYSSYILIVADIMRAARERGIPVGPGRGSAAGSLVCYALEITDIDPLPYNLLFERFINPERVSPPDIDMDFCQYRRAEIIQYVMDLFGHEHVAQIANYTSIRAKNAIADIARAMKTADPLKEIPQANLSRMSKLVDMHAKGPGEHGVLKRLLSEKVFDAEMLENRNVPELLKWAAEAEDLNRGLGVHAAGVVISDQPILGYAPTWLNRSANAVKTPDGTEMVVTQYDKVDVEDIGLLKMDFLGLKNVSIIQKTLDNIAELGQTPPDMRRLRLDDPEVFGLYQRGDVDGVFQMSSEGMRKYLVDMKPDRFEDIIAMIALYRPGPLGSGMIDTYIRRKNGEEEVDYFGLDDFLHDILEPTYGVIVYQEQVMQVAQSVAGFSLGRADILRRAMGKKKPEEMKAQKAGFMEGCASNGIDPEKAGHLFGMIEKFAEYGFNKSHSAAYALVSYQTAYLKRYHNGAFMAATIEVEKGDRDKMGDFLRLVRDGGGKISPPDIRVSPVCFSADRDGGLMIGLSGIRNLTEKSLSSLEEKRREWDISGWPQNIVELCAQSGDFNKKFLVSLNNAGAFDPLIGGPRYRSALDANVELILSIAKKMRKAAEDEAAGKKRKKPLVLADYDPATKLGIPISVFRNTPDWTPLERFKRELDALNFNISGEHPVFSCRLPQGRTQLSRARETKNASVVVLVEKLDIRKVKKDGRQFAVGRISDESGVMDFRCWPDQWNGRNRLSELLREGECYLCEGSFEASRFGRDEDAPPKLEFTIRKAELPELRERDCERDNRPFVITLDPESLDDQTYYEMRNDLRKLRAQELDGNAVFVSARVNSGGDGMIEIAGLSGLCHPEWDRLEELRLKWQGLSVSRKPENVRPRLKIDAGPDQKTAESPRRPQPRPPRG